MPFQLQDMTFKDAEAYANTYMTSFRSDSYSSAYTSETLDERVAGVIRRWPKNYSEKLNVYKKVVDTNTGELVSWVKIAFENTDIDPDRYTPSDIPDDLVIDAPPPATKAKTTSASGSDFISRATAARERELGDRPVIILKLIGTHPKAQRRGAASVAMAWVAEVADREGLPCWVTGSPAAVPLYKKFGFQVKEEIGVKLPEGSEGGTYTHTCMLREPNTPAAAA